MTEFSASEIIALAAIIMGGLTGILTPWLLQRGRHEHEKELQAQRLEHERAEAVRGTAARVYGLLSRHWGVLAGTMLPDEPPPPTDDQQLLAKRRKKYEELVSEADAAILEISENLAVLAAYGWNKEVRKAATRLKARLAETHAWILLVLLSLLGKIELEEDYYAQLASAVPSLEEARLAFRKAISGEIVDDS